MTTAWEVSAQRPRTWSRCVGRAVLFVVLAAVLVGAWMLYAGVTMSLKAEEHLHATLFTIRLVEQFVHENGRWPESWNDLEQMAFPSDAPSPLNGEFGGSHGYKWPDQSRHLRDCVAIDFDADAKTMTAQNPMDFQAIKPSGPHYEYRDYGFVESLQATLERSSVDFRPTARAGPSNPEQEGIRLRAKSVKSSPAITPNSPQTRVSSDAWEEFSGEWEMVEVWIGGKKINETEVATLNKGDRIRLTRGRMIVLNSLLDGSISYELKVALDSSQSPNVIRLTGRALDHTGIIKVKQSQLLMCVGPTGLSASPKDFLTRPGDWLTLQVLRRTRSEK